MFQHLLSKFWKAAQLAESGSPTIPAECQPLIERIVTTKQQSSSPAEIIGLTAGEVVIHFGSNRGESLDDLASSSWIQSLIEHHFPEVVVLVDRNEEFVETRGSSFVRSADGTWMALSTTSRFASGLLAKWRTQVEPRKLLPDDDD